MSCLGSKACTICSRVATVFGTIGIVLGLVELAKFTPVWQPMPCVETPHGSVTTMNDVWLNLTDGATDDCTNPTPYELRVIFTRNGELFVNHTANNGNASSTTSLIPVGHSTHNDFILKPGGAAGRTTENHIYVDFGLGMQIAGAVNVSIVHKIYLKQSMVIPLWFQEMVAGGDEEIAAYCGYTYDFVSGEKSGTICERELEDLEIPPLHYRSEGPNEIDLDDDQKDALNTMVWTAIKLPWILFILTTPLCAWSALASEKRAAHGAPQLQNDEV
jgi:hypothetical protein